MTALSIGSKLSTPHLVSILDLSLQDLDLILTQAYAEPVSGLLKNRQVAMLFYENSTRTFNSFKTAVHQLDGKTCGFSGSHGTSVLKGESLHDTIKMFEDYADCIVLRHPKDGACRWAADVSRVPIINAGDGQNEHPTQTLVDLLAIKDTQGRLHDLSIGFMGDLKYGRTVRSLCQALSLYPNNKFFLVSPPGLRMPAHVKSAIENLGVIVSETENLREVVPQVDILYVTRVQKERIEASELTRVEGSYRVTTSDLLHAREHMKILHPLPRVGEIAQEVDATKHAYYFQQARGGPRVRRSLLELMLHV